MKQAKFAFLALTLVAVSACDRNANYPVGGSPSAEPTAAPTAAPSAAPTTAPTAAPAETMFTVTLESVVGGPSPLSPGVYVIHQSGMPIFAANALDRGQGLEQNAEDGNPANLAANIPGAVVFNTPVGADKPGPATQGNKFQFSFAAKPGDRLSFVTMFGQSNDGFYAPGDTGIALFNGSTPIDGDVTSQVTLWDAGTEVNEQPGTSTSQAARQPGPNIGTAESQPIVPIADRKDGFTYGQAIKVTISHN